jgi:4-amino-4-deoxy-L-arabinose transferase-like glycosyltransferase
VARLVAVTVFAVPPTEDASSIEQIGRALAEGRGYTQPDGSPDTVLPPGVPALFSAAYAIFGSSSVAATSLQALIDLAGCLLLWAWIRRRMSSRAAMLTLALAVTSLTAIGAARIARGECVGTALLILAIAAFDTGRDRRSLPWLAASGVACGVLTLFRWNFSLLPLALAALLAFRRVPVRFRAIAVATLLGAYATILSPWLLRNYQLLGEPVLSTQSGITLYSSHFRTAGQPYGNNTRDETTMRAAQMPPLEGSHYLVAETVARLRAAPQKPFLAYPVKLFWLLQPFDWETLSWPVLGTRRFNLTYFGIVLLGLVGIRAAFQHHRELLVLLLLPLLYVAVLSFPFYGSPRFRGPAEPFLMPIAALGVETLIAAVRARRGALTPVIYASQSPEEPRENEASPAASR